MAACDQACGKMFGERFKPAIAGRNASSSENGDSHRTNNSSSLYVERFLARALVDQASRVINDVYPINVSKKFFAQRRKDKDAEKSLNIFFAPLRYLWVLRETLTSCRLRRLGNHHP